MPRVIESLDSDLIQEHSLAHLPSSVGTTLDENRKEGVRAFIFWGSWQQGESLHGTEDSHVVKIYKTEDRVDNLPCKLRTPMQVDMCLLAGPTHFSENHAAQTGIECGCEVRKTGSNPGFITL